MKIGVILAGGKSSRFKSNLPKGLHKIDGKTIVDRLIDCLKLSDINKIYIVVNNDNCIFYKNIKGVEFLFQGDLFGTGGAFYSMNGLFDNDDEIIVVNSDCFIFDKNVICNFYNKFMDSNKDLGLVTMCVEDPRGYGRIFRIDNRIKIIEEKDTDEITSKINIVNMGIYIFKGSFLKNGMKFLNVKNKESKITIFYDNVDCFEYISDSLIMSINSKMDFYKVNREFYLYNCYKHLDNGVKIYDINNTYIGENVVIGKDVEIYPNNYLLGDTIIGNNCSVLPNCVICDSKIGNGSVIGPFSNLKAGSFIGKDVVIGAFVEVKNSEIMDNVKAKHHAYLGDVLVGKNSNVGCGTIIANYDGKKKHKSSIGENCFIGSNVTIISPVSVGNNVLIAAGSTINKDICDNSLAIARERQIIKNNYYK